MNNNVAKGTTSPFLQHIIDILGDFMRLTTTLNTVKFYFHASSSSSSPFCFHPLSLSLFNRIEEQGNNSPCSFILFWFKVSIQDSHSHLKILRVYDKFHLIQLVEFIKTVQ